VVLMIWTDCGSTSDFYCGNPQPDDTYASGTIAGFAGETYYFLVDTDDDGDPGGGYTLSITNTGPIPESYDCDSPLTAVDGLNTGGDTSIAANSYDDATCEIAGGGPDQIWEYVATSSATLHVEMDTTIDTQFRCTLSARSTCTDVGTELDCENDGATDDDGICDLYFDVTSGETYYIFAETNNPGLEGGPYDLTLSYP
jgi:hypothetical protein